jgi:DNA helicase TIP49 (TBP-interacting protein)
MTEKKLRSRSFYSVKDFETCQDTFFMEVDAYNANQETEIDGAIVELNEEVNSVTDRQVKGHSDSGNNVVMSGILFHEFINILMTEFDNLKARMRSESIKLAESIKAVADKMSNKIEIVLKICQTV